MTAEDHLSRLDAELRAVRVGSHRRARILAEVRDHLLEAGPGGPERFGDPKTLARRFAEDAASSSSRTAAHAVVAAVTVTLALWAAISLDIRSHPWLNDFPGALIAVLGVQVAFVAAFLSLARTLRYRRGAVPAAGLPLVTRANAVAASALTLALAATAFAEAQHLDLARAGTWELAVAAGLAAACALTLGAAAATVRAAVHTAPVATGGGGDIVDDLAVLGTGALDRIAPHAPRLAALVRRAAASPWLDLRRHPWRFCATVAACFLIALSVGGLMQGGDPSPFVGLAEALAIVAGFAVLGRLLGLRR